MQRWFSLLVFIAGVLGIGIFIGMNIPPGEWYAALNKPFFTPPNWVFAPVWTTLYTIIGYVGWRLWQRENNKLAMTLWTVQMLLNFIWTPVFFGLHMTLLGLVIVSTMAVTLALFIKLNWSRDRVSAVLFLPYLLWVCIATALNAGIVILN